MFEGGGEEKGKVSWAWGGVWEQPVFCPESKSGDLWTFTQEAVVPLPRSRSGLHSEKILSPWPSLLICKMG